MLTFELLAVLRRDAARAVLAPARALGVVEDIGDLPIDLYSSLSLRHRAWELRANMTAADGLFVALAERLGEPFATADGALVAAAQRHTAVDVLDLRP